jgi:CO/xanthine dehydrogenase FAD-binding subunit
VRLRPFELIEPRSVAEAVEALGGADAGEARLVAGGTALVPMLRLGLLRPERVISLHRVAELGRFAVSGGGLHVGAMVTMAAIGRSPEIARRWPLLAAAGRRRHAGHPQQRHARRQPRLCRTRFRSRAPVPRGRGPHDVLGARPPLTSLHA